ncbi:MAG: peptide deformylase [Candidatus Izimaplasma sp.]|nr:peptide deformylase [Candidatus Izimaplasma bacterium]
MILMKDIIREGHPTLEKRAKDVEIPLNDETKQTLKEMMEYLENSQDPERAEKYELRPGVGLAAPQINISKRMTCIFTPDEKGEKLYKLILINPKIISHSIKQTFLPGGEGCLSVDREVEGIVPRYKKVRIRAHQYLPETDTLRQLELRVSGYVSVVLQHEIDHLDGILFPTKTTGIMPDLEPIVFPEETQSDETDKNYKEEL